MDFNVNILHFPKIVLYLNRYCKHHNLLVHKNIIPLLINNSFSPLLDRKAKRVTILRDKDTAII
jgi:hypothetical protein